MDSNWWLWSKFGQQCTISSQVKWTFYKHWDIEQMDTFQTGPNHYENKSHLQVENTLKPLNSRGVILIKLTEIGRSKNKRSSFPDHRLYTLSSMRTVMKYTIVEYRAISFAHSSFWLLWEIDGNLPSSEATITELHMLFACIQTVHNKKCLKRLK